MRLSRLPMHTEVSARLSVRPYQKRDTHQCLAVKAQGIMKHRARFGSEFLCKERGLVTNLEFADRSWDPDRQWLAYRWREYTYYVDNPIIPAYVT